LRGGTGEKGSGFLLALGRLFELVGQQADHLMKAVVSLHFRGDRLAGVKNCSVIATPEGFTDLLEALPRHFPAEVHRHHAGQGNMSRAPLAGHVRYTKIVSLGHATLNQLDGDNGLGLLLDEILQKLFDLGGSDMPVVQGGPSGDTVQGTLQAADVRFDALGDEMKDGIPQTNLHGGSLLTQDGQPSFDVRGLKLCAQTPFKTGHETFLEVGNISRRTIARKNDLAVAIEQGVEGVEEFFLGTILPGEKLDVIDQKAVRLAETAPELDQFTMLNGRDELIRKLFGGNINNLGPLLFLHDPVTDCMEQMGFP
jgi:hypothetical protein